MAILGFIIEIYAATMLLLFAVYFVRTGIERRFGKFFEQVLTGQTNTIWACGAGLALAMMIQSSAAVALLMSGFAAAGLVGFGMALAGVLGADLGSALVIQILTFDLRWLLPFLLATGGWLYLKSGRRNLRLTGRIVLGIAFILISLQLLRAAVAPVQESNFLPAVVGYLEKDFVTAFLAGAALAFVMHSSVAVILMCVTLVQLGAVPYGAGLSLVLGANLGSAIIPLWMSRGMPQSARRVPVANLLLRGSAAVIAVLVINLGNLTTMPAGMGAGQALTFAHIAFNAAVVVLALGLVHRLESPMRAMLPDPPAQKSAEDFFPKPLTAVQDPSDISSDVALTSVRQDLLNMVTLVERMFKPMLDLYERYDDGAVTTLGKEDELVNFQLTEIRRFVAQMPRDRMPKAQIKEARALVEYAIRLEAGGDVVSKRLTRVAKEKRDEGAKFSKEGWAEIMELHEAVLNSFSLARHVLLVDDLECARRLVLEKAEVKRLERKSRKAHLKRLENGTTVSFRSSDLHLETLRALRELHGHLAAVAYPILYRNGQVLETRLIAEMAEEQIKG